MVVNIVACGSQHIYVLTCSTDGFIVAEFHGPQAQEQCKSWVYSSGVTVDNGALV